MKLQVRFILLIGVLVLALSSPAPLTAQDAAYFPSGEWRTSTPEAQGMDSAALADLVAEYNLGVESLHSLLVIRNGYVVLDASTYPFQPDQPHWQFSAVKSVVSTLIGIAIDQGYIEGVDQSIWDFFSAAATANMDERKAAITIRDLLTQSSGFQQNWGMYDLTGADESWVQYVLDQPMVAEPGEIFAYTDANTHVLSAILQQATGMSALAYAEQTLFAPLGITDVSWRVDPQGVYWGGDGLAMTPYDMAKLGYLFLNRGQWAGQQIVSSAWVDEATDYELHQWSYGYCWWMELFGNADRYPAYAALGLLGQEIWVIPQANLIVVTTGNAGIYIPRDVNLVNAVVSDTALPENVDAQAELRAQIERLAEHDPTPASLSEMAVAYSGRTFTLEANPLGWQSLSIDFSADQALLNVGFADTTMTIPVGLDRVPRLTSEPFPAGHSWLPSGPYWQPLENIPIAATGGIIRENRLNCRIWDLTGGQAWYLVIRLEDALNVQITPSIPVGVTPVVIHGVVS